MEGVNLTRDKNWWAAHDDVCFNETRDGFEDALRAIGPFLAPKRKAFGKVLVTRFSLNNWYTEDRESGGSRTSTYVQHFG